MQDEINHPQHYQLFPDMEAIDVIEAALTPEEFRGYCKGNALKYRLRAGEKGPAEKCIAKANWYQGRLKAHKAQREAIESQRELSWDEMLALRDVLNDILARQAA